jgi:ABC-type dipeptide/oligopeptide/nickel transport system permease component
MSAPKRPRAPMPLQGWLGMVLVIVFSSILMWLPPGGAGPGGSGDWAWDWEHFKHMLLPAITMSVIPMGIISRTLRALVGDILAQEFIVGLRAKGLTDFGIFLHVVKNAAPTALAVMGLQLGYLLGGSILIETVFSWPGTGFLLNSAIFQRDLPQMAYKLPAGMAMPSVRSRGKTVLRMRDCGGSTSCTSTSPKIPIVTMTSRYPGESQ